MFTKEGFDDIVAQLPHAATVHEKPTVDPAFDRVLRDFCTDISRGRVANARRTTERRQT
ncbi:MAG: hypothetical protein ACRDJY_01650 [Thermoleophilaceae bacterium]